MVKLTSPMWWVGMFINTFMVMLFIYLIKAFTSKVNVPLVSDVAQQI